MSINLKHLFWCVKMQAREEERKVDALRKET